MINASRPRRHSRRQFLRDLGARAALLPFILNLPSLAFAGEPGGAGKPRRKQRLVVMFSPNGVVPGTFWPDAVGKEFTFKESLRPLEEFRARTLMLHGVCNKIKGDGDGHMRGMGCLLTGIELFPGNIQGGSDTPAGWSRGISIDQEIAKFLQAEPATRTRFGSLEFGVQVSERADTWTRMSYAGPNQPLAPISNPYQMFAKLYGEQKDRAALISVLDDLQGDFKKVGGQVSAEDRALLDQHATFVRAAEKELKDSGSTRQTAQPPTLEAGVREDNEHMPKTSRMQIELLVASMQADFARVATLQYTQSVGQAKMTWLGINEAHHTLSHEPDAKQDVQDQLTKINTWFCGELAYLVKRLAETPEPGTKQSLLDNTQVVWTNELGKGNSHTRDDIPFVLVGNGLDFKMGRSLKYEKVPHNRLLMSLAHGFGHHLGSFGNADHCKDGVLPDLV
ncbi:MAG: DUF1552 domain-containing protein [Planctomycetes bacterium]|nr:DUF1552 domain-containing protein [Planctomycetota bacterium]